MTQKKTTKREKALKSVNKTDEELTGIIDESEQLSFDFNELLINSPDAEREERDESNLISMIESSPIFACKPIGKDLRSLDSFPIQTLSVLSSKNRTVKVGPAFFDGENDRIEMEYLGFNEEILMSILIKLLVESNATEHEDETGLNFTLVTSYAELRRELKDLGKTRSLQEIKKALTKLMNVDIQIKGENMSYDTSLIAWYQVREAEKPADNKLVIKLNDIVSDAIRGKIPYRQYNHKLTYLGQNQVAVWIKKDIMINARNISADYPYKISVQDVYARSCLFDLNSPAKAKKQKLKRALTSLTAEVFEKKGLQELAKEHIDSADLAVEVQALLESAHTDRDYAEIGYKVRSYPDFVDLINDALTKHRKRNEFRIFSQVVIRKHKEEEYLYCYPSDLLVKEVKKANFREKQRAGRK